MRSILGLAVVLLAGSANAAAPGQQACAAVAEPWKASRAVTSARHAAGVAQARFAPGEGVRFALHPDGEVAYATLPQSAGEAESFGGMASFTVERAGTYSVGLSEPIWVDVVQEGKPAQAVRFGPGPVCSGIRKTVAFDLVPGRHMLELSGSTVSEVGVVIAPLP